MVLSIPGTTCLFSSNILEETLLQYAAPVVINPTIVLILLVTTGLISMSFAVLIDMILIILEFIPMTRLPKNVSTLSCMLMTTPTIPNLLSAYVLKLISTIPYTNHLWATAVNLMLDLDPMIQHLYLTLLFRRRSRLGMRLSTASIRVPVAENHSPAVAPTRITS